MIPYFPKQIGERAMLVYLISLSPVSLVFVNYIMGLGYIALGFFWVCGFFGMVALCSKGWRSFSEKRFVETIVMVGLTLRIVWVIVSYFFYEAVTGIPFEFSAADSLAYHDDAMWLASEPISSTWRYLFGSVIMFADSGYPFILSIIYRIFGPIVIIPRIINALLSTWTCVLLYKMAARTFEEETARMAAIMMVFMPNLIIYCGYHLKETLMLFLLVAGLERIDALLRSKQLSFWGVVVPSLLVGSLFLFRTVMGAAAVFAFASAILVSSAPSMKRGGKRIALIAWGVLALVVFAGGSIATEVEEMWEGREENVVNKRAQQAILGNQWAQYATGTVMAPMIVVLPFATMVDVDEQYGQQAKSGGNFIRNFMGFFALLAIYEAIRRKKWRDFVLFGAFVVAYLGIVAFSGFSNSERFLLPGLPCLIVMWAYGVSSLRKATYKLLFPWCILVVAMEIGWAFFKIGSRGLF